MCNYTNEAGGLSINIYFKGLPFGLYEKKGLYINRGRNRGLLIVLMQRVRAPPPPRRRVLAVSLLTSLKMWPPKRDTGS